MKEVLTLVQHHNHRRIAFIRGPTTSFEAEQRFAVYREVLAAWGMAEDPRLVLQGDWMRESGTLAVRELTSTAGASPLTRSARSRARTTTWRWVPWMRCGIGASPSL